MELVGRYADAERSLECLKAEFERRITEIRSEYEVLSKPHEDILKRIRSRLEPWWAEVWPMFCDDKRSSTQIGDYVIGYRVKEKLKLSGITEREAIEYLQILGFESWAVSTKQELNETALLAALSELDAAANKSELTEKVIDARLIAGLGFTHTQNEEFVIDRTRPIAISTTQPNASGSSETQQ